MAPASCLACGGRQANTYSPRDFHPRRNSRLRLPKKLQRDVLEELCEATKMSPVEVKALYSRFRRLAPSGTLTKEQFRNTMGVLGLTDNTFLPDRMFKIFDADCDELLTFAEFATSLAVMIRGTEDEKLKLSFDMTAGQRGAKGISRQDFNQLIVACNSMMNSLVAPTHVTTQDDVDGLFHDLSSDGGGRFGFESDHDSSDGEMITWEAYKAAAQGDELFLQCLGLKPNVPGRKSPLANQRNKRIDFGGLKSQSSASLPGAHGPAQSHYSRGISNDGSNSGGNVVISQAQLDELRGHLARVNALVQMEISSRPAGANPTYSFFSKGAASSTTEVDPATESSADERWWTPLPKKHFSPANSKRPVLDEISFEIERVMGWCSAAEGKDVRPERSGLPAASSEDPVPALRHGFHSPRTGGMFRVVSNDSNKSLGKSDSVLVRANVHRNIKTGEFGDCSNASLGMIPDASGQQKLGRNNSYMRGRQTRKKHRLLGPKKGLAVHFGHENWNMVVSMMIGIRMAVGRSKHEMARELQPVDFCMKEKFSIVPRISNILDNTSSRRVTMTRFIDYAPMVFQRIRASFGINHDDYLRSLGPEQLLGNMVLGNLSSLSELSSEGKSGAFFYYTADGNYMLKTVTPKEYLLLRGMLKGYYEHIFNNHGTLLVKFLGLHCLSVRKLRKVWCGKSVKKLYFVVMANMFNTPFEIHRRYDLKGSWVGRETAPEKYDPSVALKDIDFQRANECVRIGDDRRMLILKQLESDSRFLAENGIIDYSLLLGIHEIPRSCGAGCVVNTDSIDEDVRVPSDATDWSVPQDALAQGVSGLFSPVSGMSAHAQVKDVPFHRRDRGGMLSQDRKCRYFIGVIDILTPYDTMKVLEHRFKGLRHDSAGVSCCPPTMYAERFNKFMRSCFV